MPAENFIAQARTWIGTPFRHQGRAKNVGVDCAGVLLGAAWELGLPIEDFPRYSHEPDPAVLREYLASQLAPVSPPAPGDVLLMKFGKSPPTHLALRTDIGLLHAYAPARKVVETSLDEYLASCIVQAWRFPWLP